VAREELHPLERSRRGQKFPRGHADEELEMVCRVGSFILAGSWLRYSTIAKTLVNAMGRYRIVIVVFE
jgi:hypothetical protein